MRHSVAIAITLGCITVTHAQKTAGVFYPSRLVETARENIAKHDWAAQTRDDIVAEAQGWTVYSDDELWAMMFGATIPRSWMVVRGTRRHVRVGDGLARAAVEVQLSAL